ncbi:MAG: type I-C CRISPR-associated protein Cas8c/Csd1 [Desulfovibrionaceae bacterium]|jgi:CRISPR-associated protein Csd1|nr:type I-C CRISPR-associated protein Cas8c/Csd1 [Desulfovibrionaceae bacterium]
MILQELTRCYDRMLAAGEAPEFGFGMQKVHYAMTIDEAGNRVGDPATLAEPEKGRVVPVELKVPDPVERSSNVEANFAWDNTKYVLGADAGGSPKRTLECFAAFRQRCRDVGGDLDDAGMRALLRFLDGWNPEDAPQLPDWERMAGLNVVFRLAGERRYIHERPAVREAWLDYMERQAWDVRADCLITGGRTRAVRLHKKVKGLIGGQTGGAPLVSFNADAFESYAKHGRTGNALNAPIGELAAFKYATALNRLLAADSPRRMRVGENMYVFWADGPCARQVETLWATVMVDSTAMEEAALRNSFENLRNGQPPVEGWSPEATFDILGLGPNAARVVVRYWRSSTAGEVFDRVRRHYDDLAIARRFDNEPEFPTLWQLLGATRRTGSAEPAKAPLIDAFLRAVLDGADYPRALQGAVLARVRAERRVGYLRAALLKAFMARLFRRRSDHPDRMELTMTVNTGTDNIAYRLGRLFAVLEKTQQAARPGVNATLAERYLSAASNSPRAIFNLLLRKVQNDLKIIGREQGGGLAHWFRRQIEDIMAGLDAFRPPVPGLPDRFSPDQASLFLVGYYQQLAEKKDKTESRDDS